MSSTANRLAANARCYNLRGRDWRLLRIVAIRQLFDVSLVDCKTAAFFHRHTVASTTPTSWKNNTTCLNRISHREYCFDFKKTHPHLCVVFPCSSMGGNVEWNKQYCESSVPCPDQPIFTFDRKCNLQQLIFFVFCLALCRSAVPTFHSGCSEDTCQRPQFCSCFGVPGSVFSVLVLLKKATFAAPNNLILSASTDRFRSICTSTHPTTTRKIRSRLPI